MNWDEKHASLFQLHQSLFHFILIVSCSMHALPLYPCPTSINMQWLHLFWFSLTNMVTLKSQAHLTSPHDALLQAIRAGLTLQWRNWFNARSAAEWNSLKRNARELKWKLNSIMKPTPTWKTYHDWRIWFHDGWSHCGDEWVLIGVVWKAKRSNKSSRRPSRQPNIDCCKLHHDIQMRANIWMKIKIKNNVGDKI